MKHTREQAERFWEMLDGANEDLINDQKWKEHQEFDHLCDQECPFKE